MTDDEARAPRLPLRRRALYAAVTAAIAVGALLVLELGARLVTDADERDPYLHIERPLSIFTRETVEGAEHYRVTHPEAYLGRDLLFPVEKPVGARRIFCLGGSASAGWPHPPGESYSDLLEHALEQAYPNDRLEILNVSAHAFASYRVRLIFDDIIEFDPDLLVVYSGNNEFLEKRTYPGLSALARFARSSRLVHFMTRRLRAPPAQENTLSGRGRAHANHDVWMRVEARAQELRTDPEQFARVQEHFTYSIRHMIEGATRRDIPIIVVTPPSNLRDWQPNVSANPLEGVTRERWQVLYDSGRAALLTDEFAAAKDALRQALELAPGHAHTHYFLARALEGEGRDEEALASYSRARDFDANPFRAHSALNEAVRRECAGNPNAHLADADAAFVRAATGSAPGFELLLDYVHPTRAGNALVARTVFDVITQSDLLGSGHPAAEFVERAPRIDLDGRAYDAERDMQVQSTLMNLFAMMHQYEAIVQSTTRSLGLLDRGEASLRTGLPEEVDGVRDYLESYRSIFSRYVDMERRRLLKEPYDEDYERELEREYRRTLFPHVFEERAMGGD